MQVLIAPEFMLTLPRKAQRRLPEKHVFSMEAITTGFAKNKRAHIVVCICGWRSNLLPNDDQGAALRAVTEQHLRDEAAKL
jgi:hypothetical protein